MSTFPLLFPPPRRTNIRALSSNYTRGRDKTIRVLVVHDGETGEGSTAAEGMGYWFQNPKAQGSAHAGFDTDSICTYIPDGDTAWGARGVNDDGLHGEFAGRAGQTSSQWRDNASLRIIENGAIWFAENCLEHNIPARYLSDTQLADGKSKGITSHRQVTRVFKRGTHTDPGPNFPFEYLLARIRFHIARLTAPATPTPTPAPKPDPTPKEITVFLVQLAGTDPVYKSDGFTRQHIGKKQLTGLQRSGLKVIQVKTADELNAYGAEVSNPVGVK